MTGAWKYYLIVITLVLFCILEHFCVKLTDSVQSKYEESVSVEFEDLVYSSQNRDKRSSDIFPESFTLRLNIKKEPLNLMMKRNKHLSTDIPTYTHNGDVITSHRQNIQDDCGFYQDQTHMASITMECLQAVDNNSVFIVYGTLVHKGEHFILEEMSSSKDNTGNKPSYRVLQPVTSVDLGNDYLVLSELNQQTKKEMHTRRRRATGDYKVELLLVADYSVYKFWYDRSTAPDLSTQRRDDVLNNIKKVYATLLNGIDVRYSNMPGYTVTINYAGVYIAENASSAQYIESIKSSTLPVTVDANATLAAFHTWVTQNLAQLPKHDHAMLLTKYDITLDSNRDATGYAFLKGICTNNSQSVVEENFNFLTQTIAAHELGHSLGAVHDGDQNGCQRNAKYIMSAVVSATQGDYAYNPWEFSSCSKSEITSHIDTISNNCMRTQISDENPNGLDQYIVPNIGQIFNADKQCELSVGNGSYMCREVYKGDYSSVCTGLWCLDVHSHITECVLIIPGRGTTCGDKKWCLNGICTSSDDAPSVVGSCLFGDTPGIYSNGQTCQQIVTSKPWQCYFSTFNKACCQSCGNILNATNTDCEYGDRGDCSKVTSRLQCYGNERSCCGTCAKYATQIQDCKFGDKAQGCVAQNCASYSVEDYTNCCQTCYNVITTTTRQQGTGPGATTSVSIRTTTATPGSSLPNWVIPAAAGGGGVLLLLILIIIIITTGCCKKKENNDEKILKKLQKERNLANLNQPYSQGSRAENPYSYATPAGVYKSQPGNEYDRKARNGVNRQPGSGYIHPRHDIPRGQVGYSGQRGNVIDRGASVKSNVSDEHVYLDIVDPSTTYQRLQNNQGQGHNYMSVGQFNHRKAGREYTNSGYIHPR